MFLKIGEGGRKKIISEISRKGSKETAPGGN